MGGEKEEWRRTNAEAHCIEGGRDSAGGSEEQVSLDADVVIAITGATKHLTWSGQYACRSQASEGEGVEPLLEVCIEHSRVNGLEHGE